MTYAARPHYFPSDTPEPVARPSAHIAISLAFAEADEHAEIARSGGWAFVLVVLTIAQLLVALGIHFLLR